MKLIDDKKYPKFSENGMFVVRDTQIVILKLQIGE